MLPIKIQRRITMLIDRLKAGKGNQQVLLAEIAKAYNSRPARRGGDDRIQGWTYVEARDPLYSYTPR